MTWTERARAPLDSVRPSLHRRFLSLSFELSFPALEKVAREGERRPSCTSANEGEGNLRRAYTPSESAVVSTADSHSPKEDRQPSREAPEAGEREVSSEGEEGEGRMLSVLSRRGQLSTTTQEDVEKDPRIALLHRNRTKGRRRREGERTSSSSSSSPPTKPPPSRAHDEDQPEYERRLRKQG